MAGENPNAPAPGTEGITPGSPAATGTPFDLDTWLKAAPPEAIKGLSERFSAFTGDYLTETYGDMIPVIEHIRSNDKLRGRISKLVRDGKVDEDELDFLLNTGIDVYDEDVRPRRSVRGGPAHDGSQGGGDLGRARAEDDPALKEVRELRERLDRDELASNQKNYEEQRRLECVALQKEHPELRFEKADPEDPGYKRLLHISEIAEARTKANFDRGDRRVVSYKEVANELAAVVGLEPPRAAPRTAADSRIDAPPQAPRTVTEAKNSQLSKLAKAGGFRALAESTARRG